MCGGMIGDDFYLGSDRGNLWVGPHREAVAGREAVGGQITDRASVDLLAEKRPLDLQLVLVEVDVPAAPTTAPTVAARLQEVLRLDR